jgi:hypothetical protein
MSSRKTEPPITACQQVSFESGLMEERKTVTADMHEGGTHGRMTLRLLQFNSIQQTFIGFFEEQQAG